MMDEEGATEPADTYHLTELLFIHKQLAKSDRLKMAEARDKVEDIILAMVNDLAYD